eukprot:TRINITY_DN32584_c0_g3_i1.p1 TRINITY_DN32584_c0_g3~~TRINITY_DN32584_c0_g3_i1.p1  ORF type:complete len:684 (-),score=122.65 TRINITY_DN32584_c0_g3_i1:7-1812(-)
MSPFEISLAMAKMVSIPYHPVLPVPQVVNQLVQLAVFNLSYMAPEHLTRIVKVLGRLAVKILRPNYVESIQKQIIYDLSLYSADECATIVYGMAKMGCYNRELFNALKRILVERVDELRGEEIVEVVWGYTKAGAFDEKLFKTMAENLTTKVEQLSPLMMVHVLWAFASTGFRHVESTAAITREAEIQVTDFGSRELPRVLWACAKLGVTEKQAFSTLMESSIHLLPDFASQDLCNTLWAAGETGHNNLEFIQKICDRIKSSGLEHGPIAVSQMLQGLQKLDHRDEEVIELLAQQMTKTIASFIGADLSLCAFSFRKLGYKDHKVYAAIAKESLQQMCYFLPLVLAAIMQSFSAAGYKDAEFEKAALRELRQKVHQLDPWQLASPFRYFASSEIPQQILADHFQFFITHITSKFQLKLFSNSLLLAILQGISQQKNPINSCCSEEQFGLLVKEAVKRFHVGIDYQINQTQFQPQQSQQNKPQNNLKNFENKNTSYSQNKNQKFTKKQQNFDEENLASSGYRFGAFIQVINICNKLDFRDEGILDAIPQKLVNNQLYKIKIQDLQSLVNYGEKYGLDLNAILDTAAQLTAERTENLSIKAQI